MVSNSAPVDSCSREQIERVATVSSGLVEAAGLDVLPAMDDAVVLATGALVRIPYEADASTFFAYAVAELTGVVAAAHARPLHPQARFHLTSEQTRSSVHGLDRLLIVPVGPGFSEEEVGHSALGIVKTAEYTGWRWVNDRGQAAWYGGWLDNRYGSGHEAYRPAFSLA